MKFDEIPADHLESVCLKMILMREPILFNITLGFHNKVKEDTDEISRRQ
jgi:hypothetical protein